MKSHYTAGRLFCLQSLLTVIATIHSVTTAAPEPHSWGTNHNCWALGTSARVNRKGKQAGLVRAGGGGGVLFEFSSIKLRNLDLPGPCPPLLVFWSHSPAINPRAGNFFPLFLFISHSDNPDLGPPVTVLEVLH